MTGPRIGFACLWGPDPRSTWSHTPWHLREAMSRYADVVSAGVTLSRSIRLALKGSHVRWYQGRPITTWKQSRLTDELIRRRVEQTARALRCDVVLEIQDMAIIDRPYLVYQDMSFDALISMHQTAGVPLYRGMSPGGLRRRQERQRRVYERASGVLAMSNWLARNLVEVSGLPPEKVHVVHPGTSAVATEGPLPVREGPRRRLLFVGREFRIKGGDLAVAATGVLHREVDPGIRLTVVGPAKWPMPGPIPEWVDFLGPRPFADIVRLYDTHDVLVMPSRLEGFGIALAEAQSRGMPCIGRDAYAMPEIIEPGVSGALVTSDDPANLAATIATVVGDDALYAKCRARAADVAAYFSWDRAALDAVDAINRTLAR
jgi:glycosyltransferase involved in cell wall biosynthesis